MNNFSNNHFYDDEIPLREDMGIMGAAALGVLAGAGIGAAWKIFRDKLLTCRSVSDPIERNRCSMKIIDSMVNQLVISMDECSNTTDPAQCKLDILNKIDKLKLKKQKLSEDNMILIKIDNT